MKLVFCLLLFLCPYLSFSQAIKPLGIGDTLWGKCFVNMKNYPQKAGTIKDLNRQLVILDFWSTVCSSCIEAFPKMHKLQSEFKDKLQIVAIDYVQSDDAKKIAASFARRKERFGDTFTLPYVLQDKILIERFPHKTIPHIVWLNGNGKVLAITGKEEVTAENIVTALSGKPFTLPEKNDDLMFDAATENLENVSEATGVKPLYRSLITAEQPGKGVANKTTFSDKLITSRDLINMDLFSLYSMAFHDIMKVPYNRIFVSNEVRPVFYLAENSMQRKNYCYELMTSPITRKQMEQALGIDLVRYFNIVPVKKDSLLDCYVFVSTGSNEKLITKGGKSAADDEKEALRKFISNGSSDQLMSMFEKIFHKPWVNETNLSQNIDVEFPQDIFDYDINRLNAWLQQYNLKIIEEPRTITIALLTTATP